MDGGTLRFAWTKKKNQSQKMASSKNNRFTASDVERYHAGKMSMEERHALEKAALDDPFLADAVEGYAFTSTAQDDLARIRLRLEKKREKRNPVFMMPAAYRKVAVAALVLIMAGGGWLAYKTLSPEKNMMATAPSSQQAGSVPEKPAENTVADSSVKENLNRASTQVATTPTLQQTDKNITPAISGKAKDRLAKARKTATTKPYTVKDPMPPDTQTDYTMMNRRNDQDTNRGFFPEPNTNNRSGLPGNPSNQIKEKEATAFTGRALNERVQGNKANDTLKNFDVVLQQKEMQADEVVVVGAGVQKKSPARYPQVTIDTLEPTGGLAQFDDYIANNLKMPDELKTKPGAGEVELSFEVNRQGEPVNITVVRSLCDKCDEEAIRLLKEGPKWKKRKNKKGKITIKFSE
jgi:hypothetical protein